MNKRIFYVIIAAAAILGSLPILAAGTLNRAHIEKMTITQDDVPQGFMFGQIPNFAKDILKSNPWIADKKAISYLGKNIYPGGDPDSIDEMYVSIMAKKEQPYGDDLVCYIIIFKDANSSKREIEKLSNFIGYNKDRAILLTRDNIAVFIHTDDTDNYHYVTDLAEKLENRLNAL